MIQCKTSAEVEREILWPQIQQLSMNNVIVANCLSMMTKYEYSCEAVLMVMVVELAKHNATLQEMAQKALTMGPSPIVIMTAHD